MLRLRLNNKLVVQSLFIVIIVISHMKRNQRQLEAHKDEIEIISVNNRYNVIKPLGDGLTSAVFLCYDTASEDEVAVKVLKKAELLSEFYTEVSILRKQSHQGIITLKDYGTDGVLEFSDKS